MTKNTPPMPDIGTVIRMLRKKGSNKLADKILSEVRPKND